MTASAATEDFTTKTMNNFTPAAAPTPVTWVIGAALAIGLIIFAIFFTRNKKIPKQ